MIHTNEFIKFLIPHYDHFHFGIFSKSWESSHLVKQGALCLKQNKVLTTEFQVNKSFCINQLNSYLLPLNKSCAIHIIEGE